MFSRLKQSLQTKVQHVKQHYKEEAKGGVKGIKYRELLEKRSERWSIEKIGYLEVTALQGRFIRPETTYITAGVEKKCVDTLKTDSDKPKWKFPADDANSSGSKGSNESVSNEIPVAKTVGQSKVENATARLKSSKVHAFDVTDIDGNLCLEVHGEGKKKPLGQVIVPLQRFLHPLSLHRYCSKWEEPLDLPASSQWYEIYPPLAEKQNIYRGGVFESRGSAMPRPSAPIGFIHIQARLFLTRSLAESYVVSSPFVNPDRQGAFNPIELKAAVLRIQRALNFEATSLLLGRIVTWDSVPLSIATVVLFAHMCFNTTREFIPFNCMLVLCCYGMMIKGNKDYSHIIIWNDQITVDPEDPTTTFGKMQKINLFLMIITDYLSMIASVLEKCANLINYTEPRLSNLFYAALFIASLPVCFVFWFTCYLMTAFSIHVGHIIFLVFINLMVAIPLVPSLRDACSFKQKSASKPSTFEVDDQDDIKESANDCTESDKHSSGLSEKSTELSAREKENNNTDKWPRAVTYLRNFLMHVPDDAVVAHRLIAESQSLTDYQPEYLSLSPSFHKLASADGATEEAKGSWTSLGETSTFGSRQSSQTKDVLADKSIALCANLREKEHDSNKRESGWASLISKRK